MLETHVHMIVPAGMVVVMALFLAAAVGLSVATVKARARIARIVSLVGAVGLWCVVVSVVVQVLQAGVPNSVSLGP